MIIDIKDLKLCARHPLEFYCRKTLGIYFPQHREEEKEFLLSPLERSFFRNSASPEALLAIAAAKGRLPTGSFKDVARLRVEKEGRELKGSYEAWQLEASEKFSLEMNDHPIALSEGVVVTFSGKLEGLSSKGLIVHAKDDLADLLKVWPLFLVALAGGHATTLLLAKDGKIKKTPQEDPKKLLADYLTYMEWAEKKVSPLMPDWASALLSGSVEQLEKKIEGHREDDPVVQWLQMRREPLSAQGLFAEWAEKLRSHFAPFLSWQEEE